MRFFTFSVYFAAILGLSAAKAADAPDWTVDHEKSALEFIATQSGADVPGEFRSFSADISFAPGDEPHGVVSVEIDMTTVHTGDSNRDSTLRGADLFHTVEHDTATYVAETFRQGDSEGAYVAVGELTLRGETKPVELPFTLTLSDNGRRVVAEGRTTIRRLDFGVGQGQWKDTSVVADEVTIVIEIHARRTP